MYLIALSTLSQRRLNLDFLSFAMFGRLYIEHCLLVTHGQFIERSGLREILETCSLATIGVGAVVGVNQTKRIRSCVQVTLCSLY